MQNSAAVKIQPEETRARIVGLVPLQQVKGTSVAFEKETKSHANVPVSGDDDFLMQEAVNPWNKEMLVRQEMRLLAEAEELLSEARWEDMVTLLYPVNEKAPELVDAGLDVDITIKASFALDHLGRFEEALKLLAPICRKQPDHYLANYNYAYVAYNTLYNAKNRKVLLPYPRKRELIKLAHHHFQVCQKLRNDAVTPFYREGVLFHDIENNPGKAMHCFGKSIANWERLSVEEQQTRHQERPKYIRALYHLAGCCLSKRQAGRSRNLYEKVIKEDDGRDFIAPVFKYYSLGKALHELGQCLEGLEYLETAAKAAGRDEDTDFVYERAARCALELGKPRKAKEYISYIPQQKKRHYVHWTESDVMAALGNLDKAKQILIRSSERDRRSKHKALLRLTKICYRQGDFDQALDYADQANKFCLDTFGNEGHEISFWQAACFYRLGRCEQALAKVKMLKSAHWRHPHLQQLNDVICKHLRQ